MHIYAHFYQFLLHKNPGPTYYNGGDTYLHSAKISILFTLIMVVYYVERFVKLLLIVLIFIGKLLTVSIHFS